MVTDIFSVDCMLKTAKTLLKI